LADPMISNKQNSFSGKEEEEWSFEIICFQKKF
jgi:hypothetical protein